ncbi:MAG: large conductance mechanosensitive channel [Parcubacteria group bacterium Gr01-1014_56]|nr:MAG: large conductance mechanosensitive channel [Parcubacteria group bacterium Gr01-1014_56]
MFKSTRGFFAEFKSFAVKGNAFELAIAVVIGTAFTAVVNSLVGDIIMPFLGLVTNNVDLKNLSAILRPDLVIKYGVFLQAILNFLLVSLSIFVVFKSISAARRSVFREGERAIPAHEKPAEVRLLEEIRDLLRRKVGEPTEASALKDTL